MLGTITAKRFAGREFVYCALHRLDCRERERLGYVTNSAANQTLGCFWISFAKLSDASCDLWKEITGLELKIVFVQIGHQMLRRSP